MSTVTAAAASGYNIKVAVPMHPCWEAGLTAARVDVPVLFTSGSADTVCEDGCAYNLFKQVKKDGAVFFDIKGASHFDPCDAGPRKERRSPTSSRATCATSSATR
jgi:pimeloyl-ACP methyl ester carboxylesterase